MARPNRVKKEELIRSAQRRIQEKGLDQLTFKAVAEGAGVTQGTVYYHFRTKEQLLFEVVESLCNDSWRIAEDERKDGNVEETMRRLLDAALGRCTHDSFYHKLFFSLVAHSLQNAPLREQLRGMLERENANVAALLERLLPSPALDASGLPPSHLGILANALIDGLALQALVNPDFPAKEIYAGLAAALSKQGVGRPSPDR
ncbi:TetR/AcrR family transcriptional regulator [Cohnella massiliensis]|uniref:TetR/AcrR family transcriptional regulator n=1 Tax=Cohnella massiliensis TaxID=1816691 RepID=UPI0009BAC71E|nr:TetR/AcrR family transcriptional regulator [Cohnella massiliensis]